MQNYRQPVEVREGCPSRAECSAETYRISKMSYSFSLIEGKGGLLYDVILSLLRFVK